MKLKLNFCFLIICCSLNAVCQNLTFDQQNELDKKVTHDRRLYGDSYVNNKEYYIGNNNRSEYKTIYEKNDTETAFYFDKKKDFSVTGKWSLLKKTKGFKVEIYVSHCPIFSNEDGIIMEYGIYKLKNKKKSSRELLGENRRTFEEYNRKRVDGFKLVMYDSIMNFCFYKKKVMNIETEEITDVYYILGVKNKRCFRIAMSNFKEEEYEDIDKFFIDSYNKNR